MKRLILSEALKEKMISDHRWQFNDDGINIFFQSPRMKFPAPLFVFEPGPQIEENYTEDYLLKVEIQAVLDEKYNSMKKSFDEVAKDILNQYRLHLERNHTPPDVLTVSFDVHFENL